MTFKTISILLTTILSTTNYAFSQNYGDFKKDKFPRQLIDEAIVNKRDLAEKMAILENCDWKNRIGNKIDVFWLKTEQGNFFGHSYEYFMDCDNLRLIYWQQDPSGKGAIVDFMIENLEDESDFVVKKKKHLKNKKKYQQYLIRNKDK